MSTGIPYLGSKISLISKSEIRYEGILYTIDTKESTVALAKVRSYGTEDRPTDRPVAPRDETYEYIIFRGADIKDIRVCQPPKPRPTLEGGLPNDPAIVQHSRGPPGGPVHVGGPPGAAIGPPPLPPPEQSTSKPPGGSYGPIGSGPAAATAAPPAAPFAKESAVAANSRNKKHSNSSPVMDLLREGQSGASSPAAGLQGKRPSSRTSGGGQQESRRGRGGGHRGSRGGVGGGGRGGNQTAVGGNVGTVGRGGGSSGAPTGQVSNRGRGGFQPGRPSSNKKDTLKFDSEYDFEQANEEFKEFLQKFEKTTIESSAGNDKADEVEDGEIVEETGGERSPSAEVEAEPAPVCYDKSKSFFDSISCEASERQKGKSNRPDWKAEKKLNRETFGVVGRRNYYGGYDRGGRGGGYRGGYRGGHRGGGGYYGNSGGYGYGGGFNRGHHFTNGYGGSGNRQGGRGARGGWHQHDQQSGGGRGRGRGGGAWRAQQADA